MFNVKFSKSKNFKEEYCCTPIVIGKLFPIKNSDYLALTQANGFPIIVRKDQVCTGDIMFYVSNESQIKSEFLAKNNLFAKSSFNKDKNVKGYFDNNGRVRILKLRGEYSLGYLFSIAELQKVYPKLEITDIRIGESFDTINGELFVKAYCPPIKINSVRKPHEKLVKKFSCIIPEYFHFHYDTSPLNQNINRIKPDDIITISLKLHGCVDAETLINTNQGIYTIKEIVDNKMDVLIEAYDLESKQKVFVPIDQYYTFPNDGDWYEIELEDGKKLTITGNNPVYLPELNCYRKVWNIKVGDVLLIS